MSENIFWVWNGWGILFTSVVMLWQFLHIIVTTKVGPIAPVRNFLALIMIIAVVLTFIMSGWIAGLLAIPIGMFVGVVFAKILLIGQEQKEAERRSDRIQRGLKLMRKEGLSAEEVNRRLDEEDANA